MNRRVTVELIVDSNGAVQGVRSYNKEMRVASQTTDKAGKSVADFGKIFNVALGNIAASAIQGAFRLFGRFVGIIKDGVRFAAEQDQVTRKLAQALRNMGDASEESLASLQRVANEQQNLTGVSNEVIENAQAMLLTFQEVSGREGAELLTSRLIDVARGVSKTGERITNLNNVAGLFGRVLTGSAASLREVGISMTEVQEQSFNAAEGMDKVRILAEIIDANVGGLAAAAADPFDIMNEAASDAAKTIGQELLPELQESSRQVTALLQSERTQSALSAIGRAVASVIEFGISALNRSSIIINSFVFGVRNAVAEAFQFITKGFDTLIAGSTFLGLDTLTLGLVNFRKETQNIANVNRVAADAAKRRATEAANLALQLGKVAEAGQGAPGGLTGAGLGVNDGDGGAGGGSGGSDAEKEAEKRRRLILDLEFKTRELQIQALRDGRDKVAREIALQFDQRREAFRRRFGALSEEMSRLFAELERQALAAAADTGMIAEDELDLGEPLKKNAAEIAEALKAGLVDSIKEVDEFMSLLQEAFDSAETDAAREELQALIDKLAELKGSMEDVGGAVVDIGPTVEAGLNDVATSFLETLGAFAAGGADLGELAGSILLALSDLAIKVGRLLIGFGIGSLSLQSLLSNPVTAIGAGAALVALGSFARSTIAQALDTPNEQKETGRVTGFGVGDDLARAPGRQFGGRVLPGLGAIVGESGAEFFRPDRPGTIIPSGRFAFGDVGAGTAARAGGLDPRFARALERLAGEGIRIRGESRTEGDVIVTSYDTAKERRQKTIGDD